MAQDGWKKETDETECHSPEGLTLCVNNCGFFGSAVTNNLCSKCYRDLFMKQQLVAAPAVPAVERVPNIVSSPASSEPVNQTLDKLKGTTVASLDGNQAEGTSNKHPPNRCLLCRKKVGFTGFKCRCGSTFCSVHRYSETHGCSFDYKTAGRAAIAKENPVVKAEKIEKI